jgi:hypothetical protein
MKAFLKTWTNRAAPSFAASSSEDAFELSRRAMLGGLAAAVACGAVATMFPSPAGAQDGEDYNDEHSRRRSRRNDDDDDDGGHSRRRSLRDHSRRRSRRDHGRRRSRGHGRRRSRREYRDWNEECFLTPFGWVCF